MPRGSYAQNKTADSTTQPLFLLLMSLRTMRGRRFGGVHPRSANCYRFHEKTAEAINLAMFKFGNYRRYRQERI
jgi:hypothetical protein